MSYNCEIVADSINTFGNRITTFLITFPRFILAEFNTHRMFSRNSASSRAIPFKKMFASVEKNPFIPINWMRDHRGMQGSVFFTDADLCDNSTYTTTIPSALKNQWLEAKDNALKVSYQMWILGLTHQICNRLLEPFMWHTCLITSTEWENFFALRANDDAEIHIKKIAYLMLDAYNTSTPNQLNAGQWHIPFFDKINEDEILRIGACVPNHEHEYSDMLERKLAIATAICARTSYTLIGEEKNIQDYAADIKLHDRLEKNGHWSPFEHCARPMNNEEFQKFTHTQPIGFQLNHDLDGSSINAWDGVPGRTVIPAHGMDIGVEFGWAANFKGFIPYRKFFNNENAKDTRVVKPSIKMKM